MMRSPELLNRDECGLVVIDIQERISSVMLHRERVITETVKAIEAFGIMGMPCFVTEQYPRGLGRTVPAVADAMGDTMPVEKLAFSSAGTPKFHDGLKGEGVSQLLVTGIETHVCVLQTVMDLLSGGYLVHVAADAVSSRKELDYTTALLRMRQAGAVVTTVEAALFELLVQAGTDEFRQISKLVK